MTRQEMADARVEGMRAEVARLTEERDTLSHLYTLSETAKNLAYAERGKADTAIATLRGKIGELREWLSRNEHVPTMHSEALLALLLTKAKMDALGLPDTEAK